MTEEVWQERTTDPRTIKKEVETRFKRVFRDELYDFVPQKLYELKRFTLISFGKVEGIKGVYPSLTMKNMFGLIPDPLRSRWHEPSDEWLCRSMIDINKVYTSIFNVYGICEAIRCATVERKDGEIKTPWGSYDVARDLGVIALSRSLVSLDSNLCSLIRVDPESVPYLKIGEETFGSYDKQAVKDAKESAKEWVPI